MVSVAAGNKAHSVSRGRQQRRLPEPPASRLAQRQPSPPDAASPASPAAEEKFGGWKSAKMLFSDPERKSLVGRYGAHPPALLPAPPALPASTFSHHTVCLGRHTAEQSAC